MTGKIVGLTKATPRPAPRYIDANSLRFRPLVASNFVMFLPAMVEVGKALLGKDWRNAENVIEISGTPLDPALVKNLNRACRYLVQAVVDQRVAAFVWRQGLSTTPPRLNPAWLADNPSTLQRQGYIWKDKKAHYVLLNAGDVSAVVQSLPVGAAYLPPNLDLSGDMRLMLQVVQECGIGPSERAAWSKDSIAAEVKRIAERDSVPMTPRRATEMARLIKGER